MRNEFSQFLHRAKFLKIRVLPNSKKNELREFCAEKNFAKIAITAPAFENRANDAIEKFFRKNFKIKIRITRGEKSRDKFLEILRI